MRVFLSVLIFLALVGGSSIVRGQGGTGRDNRNSNENKGGKTTPTSSRSSTRTPGSSRVPAESTASLDETMNWIGQTLTTPSLFIDESIEVTANPRAILMYTAYTKELPGSPSFKVEVCTVMIERAYKLTHIEGEGGRNRFEINIADIDPRSISLDSEVVSIRAVKPTIRLSSSYEPDPKDNVDLSGIEAAFHFKALADAKSFERAVRHAVKLCGGKPTKF